MSAPITIVRYGMGNLGSVANMLKKVGVEHRFTDSPADIETAEKLILPGVGAFDAAVNALRDQGYYDVLDRKVRSGTPVMGICLGMQLLGRSSEEGKEAGFGWIQAASKRFVPPASAERFRIPHMGWNSIRIVRDAPIFERLRDDPDPRFYFVHSYHVVCDDPADQLAVTPYGLEFTSMVNRGNIWGAQFHPEKSHRFGMELLRNFARAI